MRLRGGALGIDSAKPLYVGVGADGEGMSETLFILFGVEDGWAASATEGVGCGDGRELLQLRRLGFRFIALADDNFYPVTITDLNLARMQKNSARITELETLRAERFELMARLAQFPDDMVFFTQITMEAAEDTDFLDAMKAARIKGALVGVEAVTPAGLKDVYKDFNFRASV